MKCHQHMLERPHLLIKILIINHIFLTSWEWINLLQVTFSDLPASQYRKGSWRSARLEDQPLWIVCALGKSHVERTWCLALKYWSLCIIYLGPRWCIIQEPIKMLSLKFGLSCTSLKGQMVKHNGILSRQAYPALHRPWSQDRRYTPPQL